MSVWRRPGSRRNVYLTATAARRLADAVVADDDGEIVTETGDGGAEVVVRERNGHRELTLPRQLRRGRRLVRLNPFETAVANALREAAGEVERQAKAGGEAS
mgnify:FL=1